MLSSVCSHLFEATCTLFLACPDGKFKGLRLHMCHDNGDFDKNQSMKTHTYQDDEACAIQRGSVQSVLTKPLFERPACECQLLAPPLTHRVAIQEHPRPPV